MSIETKPGVVTDEQRERFERDGFLVVDDLIAPERIDAVVEEFEPLFLDDSQSDPQRMDRGVLYVRDMARRSDYHLARIMDAWRISDNTRAIALEPRVLSLLEELYGRTPLPFQTLNFPMGTEQPAHTDAMFFDSDPRGFMCGVWIALEDVDMDNGPLVYYPGSHKRPTPAWEEVEEEVGERLDPSAHSLLELRAERNRLYTAYTTKLIEARNLEPDYGTIRKGQAVIWAANLLHGGAPQRDSSRTRRSQVTHYLFEGCRMQRPLWSLDGKVFYDYPTWVREPVPGDTPDELHEAIRERVPAGATLLMATNQPAVASIEGYDARPFPIAPDGSFRGQPAEGAEVVRELEREHEAGARYVVFPKLQLWALQYPLEDLQQHLESTYSSVLRDGALGVVFELD